MERTKLKTYLSNFSILPALMILSVLSLAQTAKASGADDYCDDMECNSFFMPEVIQNSSESPMFRSGHLFYLRAQESNRQDDVNAVNTKEWRAYLENSVKEEQLTYLLYKMEGAEVVNLVASLKGEQVELKPETYLLRAQLKTYGKTDKVLKALSYLLFAKKVEPLATRNLGRDWWDTKPNENTKDDIALAKKLLEASKSLIIEAGKDTFLVNKYRMQVIRIHYYAGFYNDAIASYTAIKGSLTTDDSTKFRIMEYAAGAMYKTKKYARANYIFSLIYDRFAPMKKSAFFSFHPKEDSDWKEALAMAKSSREKEVLWQIIGAYADGKTGIKEIYALNKLSDLLPLLLVREVNMAEESWYANQERIKHPGDFGPGKTVSDLEAVGPERIQLIQSIADSGKVYKPYLWQLAVAHLYVLANDLGKGNAYLWKALKSAPNVEIVKAQIKMTSLFSRLRAMSKVDPAQETILAQELTWLDSFKSDEKNYRAQTLNFWAREKLSEMYAAKGDYIRALFLKDDARSLVYQDNDKLNKIISFLNQSDKSAFDTYLSKVTEYTIEQLNEIKAINLAYKGELKEALALMERAGSDVAKDNLSGDPFMIHINDCHDCDFAAPHTSYTKVSFLKKMLELTELAKQDNQAGAEASFELANAYYNMSYYGNAREFYITWHGNFKGDDVASPLSQNSVMKQELSEKYYARAAQLTADKEFKAKATFMLAKTEQNNYINANNGSFGHDDEGFKVFVGKYYKALKDGFSDSQYIKEVIEECGYFKSYFTRP